MPLISLGPFGNWGTSGDGGGAQGNFSYDESSSFGGSASSGSDQMTSQVFPDQVWGQQAPFFQNLWGQGAGMLSSGGAQQQGQDVFNMGAQGYNQLMNPGSNPMIDIYAQDLGRAFNQEIMPGINRSAMGGNMIGGSRQGVAEGLAAGEMGRNLQNFGGQQYAGDMQRMLGATGQLPGFGNFGMGIPWFNMQQMSGLLGAPVVLDQGSYAQSTGSQKSSSADGSSSFGYSTPDEDRIPGAGGVGGGPDPNIDPRTGLPRGGDDPQSYGDRG